MKRFVFSIIVFAYIIDLVGRAYNTGWNEALDMVVEEILPEYEIKPIKGCECAFCTKKWETEDNVKENI